MSKRLKIAIFNDSFKHIKCITPDRKPKYFDWVFVNQVSDADEYDYICLTDNYIFSPDVLKVPHGKLIALLVESRTIVPNIYEHAKMFPYWHCFKYVFTHNDWLLNNLPQSRLIPANGVWVGTEYGGGSIGYKPKTKHISLVTSDKIMCPLHNTRLQLAHYLNRHHSDVVDVFGPSFNGEVKIAETLEDYKFSIVVENDISSNFFTEKLLNCLATGTVPIYIGAKNLSAEFENSVLRMRNVNEVINFVSRYSKYKYESYLYNSQKRIESMIGLVSDKYLCPEDYIYKTVLEKDIQ